MSKTESRAIIAPQGFLKTYDLIPDVTSQYDPEWDDEDLLVIDLDDAMDTYGTADESED